MTDNVPTHPAGCKYLAPADDIISTVPAQLRTMARWTAWAAIPNKKGGKPAKKPLSLTNDSSTWKTFGAALAAGGAGVGFQMMGVSTLVGLDIDGCVDPTTGAVSEFARSLLDALPETYAEVTPSGKGLRLFATLADGQKPPPEFLSRAHGVECYTGRSARFLTVTGRALPGRAGKLADLTPAATRMLAPLAATVGGGSEVEIKLPVPTVERLAEWQKLFDKRLPYAKLRAEWREFLESGDIPGGRSEKTFAISCKLIEERYRADEVFAILVSAPGPWEAALDKRDQDPTRARSLLWADIGRAQKVIRAEDVDLQARAEQWSGLGLKTQIEGKRVVVQKSSMNALRIITGHEDWRSRFALDVTTGLVLLDATPLDDTRLFDLQEKVSAFAGWEPNAMRQWWTDIIRAAAEQNPVNPRERELRALSWDGTQRLDTWFTDHVAAEDSALNRTLGRKWLISLVARWVDPGCKCDTVLILQGVEGARKNTFFETIAGGVERVVAIDGMERDDKLTVARAWIGEMPEAALFRRADRNRLKGFITQAVDQYRPPYAAAPVTVKRAFVLVSTANGGHLFNSDQDGLRRFWPVEVKRRIDYEWVAEHREQLLAEALLAYDLEEPWWFDATPDELRERVQDAVEDTAVDDAIRVLIRKHYRKGGMSLTEVSLEVGALIGYRPHDRVLSTLLEKHGVRRRRTTTHRFWLHDTWARPGVEGEADVIPLRRTVEPVKGDDEVLA